MNSEILGICPICKSESLGPGWACSSCIAHFKDGKKIDNRYIQFWLINETYALLCIEKDNQNV